MQNIPKNILEKILKAKEQQLKQLNLAWSKLTEIPNEVSELKYLEKLILNNNKISAIPDSITRLQNLTELDLSSNKISTISKSITRLQNLTGLYLGDNKISAILESITHLQNLTELYLNRNQISTIPEAITRLRNLTVLDLNSNQISTIPESITHLQNLTRLDLSSNQISTIPESITRLQNLTRLYLNRNQLVSIPEPITCLQNLTGLYLSGNKISTIPESITRLHNLIRLDLTNNQITSIPDSITRLKNLTGLYLGDNQLASISESITRLQNLTRLYLGGNPIATPPLEIVEKGIEAIREYFRQIEREGVDYLYEAKLLIIGEGGAGKTTLAKKIDNLDYQLREDEETTEGIDVVKWHFLLEKSKEFRVNIWDFGGQEIYHATHQFFLTKRSLYALVADSRKEDTDFYYWLNVVELLSDNSPLLIIKNEKQDRHREINENQLRGEFNNLKDTLATNLATNRGVENVLKAIEYHITKLPHIGSALPTTWVKVREALEQDPCDYISFDEYLKICQESGFTQHKDKLQLSGYLHDLGVCLHFQDDPLLKQIVILKPAWGTDAVYQVLDNPTVIRNLGKFNKSDLAAIWHEEKYANKQDELLQLMMKFKLCYKIPSSNDTYIAPQLLTLNQPHYPWDETNNLILRYTYEFMPKGILTQFIVAMHPHIDKQKYVWRSGVILHKDATKAEVIENYSKREIRIRIAGRHKKDLMTIITYELDRIHAAYKRLKYSKLIPCNCVTCKNSQEPHFYRFDTLREFYGNGQTQIQCQKKPYQMVDVLKLIDDAIGKQQFFEEEKRIDKDAIHIEKVENLYIERRNENMSKNKITAKSSWANGSFYLFVFMVVIALLSFIAGNVNLPTFVLIIVAGVLFIPLIGAFQLRMDERLSERNFIELVKLVIKQLPLIKNLPFLKSSQNKEAIKETED